jgi:hypothetical protein
MLKQFIDKTVEKVFWRVGSSIVQKALDRDSKNIEACLHRRALEETADFVQEHMSVARMFRGRWPLHEHAIAAVTVQGSFAEFGVYKGESINFIAKRTDRRVYGFDSFEGLPEDWIKDYTKERFRVDALPQVRANVSLVKGWYEESLPPFLAAHDDAFAYLHIDCDLYSSTRTVFDLLVDRLQDGTVVTFDEFFNYPGWRAGGEYKAFLDFVEAQGLGYEYLGYNAIGPQVSVRLHR